jgi:hypothetical protein
MDSKRVPVSTKRRRFEARKRHSLHDRRSNINALPEQFFDTRISLAKRVPRDSFDVCRGGGRVTLFSGKVRRLA